jgi:hypothetical protein
VSSYCTARRIRLARRRAGKICVILHCLCLVRIFSFSSSLEGKTGGILSRWICSAISRLSKLHRALAQPARYCVSRIEVQKARKRVNPTMLRALVLHSRRPNVTSDFWSNPPVVASASSCGEQPPTAALAPVDATAYERSRRVDVQSFGSGGCRAAPTRKAEHSAPILNYFPSYTTVVSSADCRRRRWWYAPSPCSAEISASKHVHRVQHPVLHCARLTAESAIHYKHCG